MFHHFLIRDLLLVCPFKGGSTLVTLPRIVTPYRNSVDGTRARVTYQKLVTRSLVPSTLSRYGVTTRGNVTSVDPHFGS